MKTQAIKFKWLISEYDVRSTENTRYPLMSVSQYLGVVPRSELKGDEGRAASTENYKTSKPGQVVLNRMSAASGALGLATEYGLVSPDYAVLQPSNFIEPRYLYYLMKSDWFTGQMVARLKGIGAGGESASVRTPRVNISDLGDINVNLPPIEEQRRIVDYLDERLETINKLIKLNLEKNQKFAEIIFSIIKEAYEPFPSRIPLKYLVSETRPITYGIVQAGENYSAGIPYIRPVDMTERNGVISEEELLRTSPDIALSYKRSEVKEHDLVVSIGPSFGKVMVVPKSLEGANLTQGTARVSISSEYSRDAIYWWLQSKEVKDFWNSSIGGATFHALNLEPLAHTPTPIISKSSGDELSFRLAKKIKSVEEMRNRTEKMNTKLMELKASLITESVHDVLDKNKKLRMQ